MRKRKSLFSILLFLFVMLASCGKTPVSEPVSDAVSNSEITWWVVEKTGVTLPFTDSDVSMGISNAVSVKPSIIGVKQGEYFDRFMTSGASGTLPDLITIPFDANLYRKTAGTHLAVDVGSYNSGVKARISEKHGVLVFGESNGVFAIPGGMENSTYPCEGMFINKKVHESMGSPAINTLDSLADFAARFAIECENMRKIRPVPFVFGVNGDGHRTFEHLFGVYETNVVDGAIKNKLYSPGFKNLFTAIRTLSAQVSYMDTGLNILPESLYEVMNDQAMFFIGAKSDVLNYNRLYPENPYEPMAPVGEMDGLLKHDGRSRYLTFLMDTAGKDRSARLVNYLLSQEGMELTMYGVRNQHYLKDGDIYLRTGWVKNDMKLHPNDFISSTGIGALPYLADIGFDEIFDISIPGGSAEFAEVSDFAMLASAGPAGKALESVNARINSLYTDVALGNVSSEDAAAGIMKYRDSKESSLVNNRIAIE